MADRRVDGRARRARHVGVVAVVGPAADEALDVRRDGGAGLVWRDVELRADRDT